MIHDPAAQVKASARLGFQFSPTPAAVIGSGLPSTAVLLFSILIDESKRRGWRTRLTNAALAARLGRTPRTIKRLLALLESHGLVARDLVADGRIRTGIKITWDGVGHPQPMNARTEGRESPAGGKSDPLKVGHSGLPSSESPVQSALQTGEVSTSKEEKTESSPPLSPEDIRRAIADGIAGKFAPMLFDAEPSARSSAPTTLTTSHAKGTDADSTPSVEPTTARRSTPARTATAKPYGGLPLRRAGVSAVAACFSPAFGAVRNTPEDLMRQLRERRKRVGNPSPAPPIGGPPPTGERPAILPNPPSRGALANLGKL